MVTHYSFYGTHAACNAKGNIKLTPVFTAVTCKRCLKLDDLARLETKRAA